MKAFFFKQFKIYQDKTAMKVGTDGVLLGAWTNNSEKKLILDIGTGTALIAIMMAQKNSVAKITAIEIEENAFLQAKENIKNCPWSERINVFHTSLQKFKTNTKFDLIVSNPPFFNNSFQAKTKKRNQARHNDTLNFEILLEKSASLLASNGNASFIIPYSEKERFINIAEKQLLYPKRILNVKGNYTVNFKRVLIEFSFNKNTILEQDLVIEKSRHNYTKEYIDLVQEFYFKM